MSIIEVFWGSLLKVFLPRWWYIKTLEPFYLQKIIQYLVSLTKCRFEIVVTLILIGRRKMLQKIFYLNSYIKIIYTRRIGPTYELYSSSQRTAVVPCLRTTCIFWLIFLGWVMLPHPQATSTDHGGPRTSDHSIERRRRNHFNTAPHFIYRGWISVTKTSKTKFRNFFSFLEISSIYFILNYSIEIKPLLEVSVLCPERSILDFILHLHFWKISVRFLLLSISGRKISWWSIQFSFRLYISIYLVIKL